MRRSLVAVAAAALIAGLLPISASNVSAGAASTTTDLMTCPVNADVVIDPATSHAVFNAAYVGCVVNPGAENVSAWTITWATGNVSCLHGGRLFHLEANNFLIEWTRRDLSTATGTANAIVEVDLNSATLIRMDVHITSGPFAGAHVRAIAPDGPIVVDGLGCPGINRISFYNVQTVYST
ncbi:hypothetical protein GCM10012275_64610 [Longimycelium tulufanense]|uniref:Uncharacterized protein n=1 Tax=Longimycelium tulufanense TaxID=907463 RepID=A0A8J3FZI5_9PSEU|nr:hypothetical protein [Longimycelium tulufanense]GGM84934.1 hypothetical protein GCM10012275_64610 [Longimycelium tulufanense]